MKMARALPAPKTLKEAIEMVIEQNIAVGYVPADFIRMTRAAEVYALLKV